MEDVRDCIQIPKQVAVGGQWKQDSTFGRADDKEDDCCNDIHATSKNGLFEADLEVEGNIDCLGTVTAPTFRGISMFNPERI